ncbi:MAG: hypothetical protein J1E31_04540 [Helicobacter sp.]|nr:hypothetical protein [Helicobacter sp.]
MFDYTQYENATKKELFSALLLAEKKAEKLALQVKENKEITRFLKSKIKQSLSKSTRQNKGQNKAQRVKRKEQKMQNEPTKETLLALKNARSVGVFDNFEDFKKALGS